MAFFARSSFVLFVPRHIAAEAAQHGFGDVALEATHATVDADADASGFEAVFMTALIRRRSARGLRLLVLLEEGVDDLFGGVSTHVLIQ